MSDDDDIDPYDLTQELVDEAIDELKKARPSNWQIKIDEAIKLLMDIKAI